MFHTELSGLLSGETIDQEQEEPDGPDEKEVAVKEKKDRLRKAKSSKKEKS